MLKMKYYILRIYFLNYIYPSLLFALLPAIYSKDFGRGTPDLLKIYHIVFEE